MHLAPFRWCFFSLQSVHANVFIRGVFSPTTTAAFSGVFLLHHSPLLPPRSAPELLFVNTKSQYIIFVIEKIHKNKYKRHLGG
jgi:hypothetical protein